MAMLISRISLNAFNSYVFESMSIWIIYCYLFVNSKNDASDKVGDRLPRGDVAYPYSIYASFFIGMSLVYASYVAFGCRFFISS